MFMLLDMYVSLAYRQIPPFAVLVSRHIPKFKDHQLCNKIEAQLKISPDV